MSKLISATPAPARMGNLLTAPSTTATRNIVAARTSTATITNMDKGFTQHHSARGVAAIMGPLDVVHGGRTGTTLEKQISKSS